MTAWVRFGISILDMCPEDTRVGRGLAGAFCLLVRASFPRGYASIVTISPSTRLTCDEVEGMERDLDVAHQLGAFPPKKTSSGVPLRGSSVSGPAPSDIPRKVPTTDMPPSWIRKGYSRGFCS